MIFSISYSSLTTTGIHFFSSCWGINATAGIASYWMLVPHTFRQHRQRLACNIGTLCLDWSEEEFSMWQQFRCDNSQHWTHLGKSRNRHCISCFNHTDMRRAIIGTVYTQSEIHRSPKQSPVAVLKLDVLMLKVITESYYSSFLYLRRFRQLSHSLGWDDACVSKATEKPTSR